MVCIEYKSNESDFAAQLQNLNNDHRIYIRSCPTTLEASKLISQPWFLRKFNENNERISLILKINEKLNLNHAEKPKISEFKKKKSVLISFESTKDENFIIYWKNQNEDKYRTLELNENIPPGVKIFIRDFLIESQKTGHHGLLPQYRAVDFSKLKIRLNFLGNSQGLNLLMLASQSGNVEVVRFFLTLPFDVSHSVGGKTAIDHANEKQHNEVTLMLLKANSVFPSKFDFKNSKKKKATENIKKFIQVCEYMHDAIEYIDQNEIERIISENKKLRHFYSKDNVSAAAAALKAKKIEIYNLLISKNVCIGPNENVDDLYDTLTYVKKEEISKLHQNNAKELPEKHLMILISKSFVSHSDPNVNDRLDLIKDAFEVLNSIPIIKKNLKIIAASKSFGAYFDFTRDSIYHLDPTESPNANGVFYFTGEIIVAAKDLLNPETKFKAIGVLAHELCHYAMHLIFRNFGRPYQVCDEICEAEFKRISEICKTRMNSEELISLVYTEYDSSLWHAELIVRIPHSLAQYFNNPQKLQECRVNFPELFTYFEIIIVPLLENSLSVLEKLENSPDLIQWNDLTEPMQMFIKNSEISFQGQKVKFNELLFENSEIFNSLPSSVIVDILKENSPVVCKEQELQLTFFIDRKFVDGKVDFDLDIWDEDSDENSDEDSDEDSDEEFKIQVEGSKKFDEICENEDIVLLSDAAGAGKTTTFRNFSRKLKENSPNFWVSYIDLKKHLEVYEKYKDLSLDYNLISEILLEILKLTENEIETKIFLELFSNGKVILLWDGVDEISSTFNALIINLTTKIRKLTKNCQWISTRPEYAEQLEGVFNKNSYKMVPYSKNDRDKYLEHFCAERNLNSNEKMRIKNFIEEIEKLCRNIQFENPLMLQIICELSLDKEISVENLNHFKIYEKFVGKKLEIIDDKGKVVQRDRDKFLKSKKMNIYQVFQVYALKLLYEDGYENFMTNKTEEISNFKLLKIKIPFDYQEISHLGIVTVKSDGDFDFVHRTFAEYFVADFLIENIYNTDEQNEIDSKMFLNLLINVATENSGEVIKNFISSYLNSNPKTFVHELVRKVLLDFMEYQNIKNYYIHILKTNDILQAKNKVEYALHFLKNFSTFFAFDYEILRNLWLLDEDETFYIWLMKFISTEYMIRDDFYDSEFNKITQKYFTDEKDLEKFYCGKNQRGNILFFCWCLYNNKINCRSNKSKFIEHFLSKTETKIEGEDLKLFLREKSFLKFLKICENEEEKKEIYLRNFPEIAAIFCDSEDFDEIWNEGRKLLGDETFQNLELLLYKPNVDDWKDVKELMAKYLDDEEQNLLLNELKNEEKFTKIEIFRGLNENKLIYNEKEHQNVKFKFLKLFAEFVMSKCDEVKQKDFFENSKFLDLLFDHNNQEFFDFIEDLRTKCSHLSDDRLMKLFQDENSLFDVTKFASLSFCEKLINFMSNIFKNNKKELKELLLRKEKYGTETMFDRFRDDKSLKDKFELFTTNFQEIFTEDERIKFLHLNSTQLSNKTFTEKLDELLKIVEWYEKENSPIDFDEFYETFKQFNEKKQKMFYLNAMRLVFGENSQIFLNFKNKVKNILSKEISNSEIELKNVPEISNDLFSQFVVANCVVDNLSNKKEYLNLDLISEITKDKKYEKICELIKKYFKLEQDEYIFDYSNLSDTLKHNYEDLFNNFADNLSMLQFLSKTFIKDVKKVWKLNKSQNFFIWFAKNHPQKWIKNLENLKKIANEFFTGDDLEKLYKGRNQRGNILFIIWENSKNENFIKILQKVTKTKIDEEILQKIKEQKSFLNFYNLIEESLSIKEKKELFLRNSKLILNKSIEQFEDFHEILIKASEVLLNDYFRELYVNKILNLGDENCLSKILNENETFLNLFTNWINEYYEDDHMTCIEIPDDQAEKYKFVLSYSAVNANEIFLKFFWNLIEEKLPDVDERKILLKLCDFYKFSVLHCAIYNKNKNSFNFIVNLYRKYLTEDEIRQVLKNNLQKTSYVLKNTSTDTHNQAVEFLQKLFKDQEEVFNQIIN